MAPGAEAPGRDPDDEPSISLDRALRFFEGLAFCCLAAVVVLWMVDRSRSVGFDPVVLEICDAETCEVAPQDGASDAWAQFIRAVDYRGLVFFSQINTCRFAADILQNRATEDGAARVLNQLQSQGTLVITPIREGRVTLSPGPNNDGFSDILRDALRWQGTRGCHPMRYAGVFWPLCGAWFLLLFWRHFRHRQQVWAER